MSEKEIKEANKPFTLKHCAVDIAHVLGVYSIKNEELLKSKLNMPQSVTVNKKYLRRALNILDALCEDAKWVSICIDTKSLMPIILTPIDDSYLPGSYCIAVAPRATKEEEYMNARRDEP